MTELFMNLKIYEGRSKNKRGSAPLLNIENKSINELKTIMKKYFG